LKSLIIILIILLSGFSTVNSQWVKVCDIYSGGVDAFADNGSIIYAAVTGDGIYKSINNGNNWILLNPGLSYVNQWGLIARDSFVFIGTDSGMFKSTNNGNNWTLSNRWALSLTILNKDNINYIFAGAYRIYISSDWGENWEIVNNGLPNQYFTAFSMSSTENIVYAGITESENNTGIYKTTNLGINWTFISPNFNIYSKSLYSYDNLILSGGSEEVAISTDYGNNWRHIQGMQNVGYLFGFASNGTKDIFISSWSRGFYVSNDSGQTWYLKNEGLGSLYPTALHRFGNYLYISLNPLLGNGGIFRRPISEVIGVNNISSEIPNSSQLFQNYPNPFNSMTNVQWSMYKTGYVKIEIFDITGKEVATLVNEKQNAGVYKVMFDAGSLPSGIYFYTLKIDGNKIDTKKLLYIK
jgi:hypothetical protein